MGDLPFDRYNWKCPEDFKLNAISIHIIRIWIKRGPAFELAGRRLTCAPSCMMALASVSAPLLAPRSNRSANRCSRLLFRLGIVNFSAKASTLSNKMSIISSCVFLLGHFSGYFLAEENGPISLTLQDGLKLWQCTWRHLVALFLCVFLFSEHWCHPEIALQGEGMRSCSFNLLIFIIKILQSQRSPNPKENKLFSLTIRSNLVLHTKPQKKLTHVHLVSLFNAFVGCCFHPFYFTSFCFYFQNSPTSVINARKKICGVKITNRSRSL